MTSYTRDADVALAVVVVASDCTVLVDASGDMGKGAYNGVGCHRY